MADFPNDSNQQYMMVGEDITFAVDRAVITRETPTKKINAAVSEDPNDFGYATALHWLVDQRR
jgi:hypothetical protein